jgi:NAD(P)H-nitrite reductase large subunit
MESKLSYHYILIGAGIAGLSAITKIREKDKLGSILWVSNEDRWPYKRTKINKSIAKGFSINEFQLNTENWFKENSVDLIFGEVVNLETQNKTIALLSGDVIGYQKLLLAQGAVPFYPEISGVDASDMLDVHFAKNVEYLMQHLHDKKEILIVGGSVEGLETANQLVKLGKKVVVVERLKNPLAKLFPDHITDKIYTDVRNAGVVYLNGFVLPKLVKTNDNKFKMDTPEYKTTFDALLVCAGTRANTVLAQKAGLAVDKGILVNEMMQTSDSHIFAAGDVAQHADGSVTGLWHPAEHQGYCAGENMVSVGKPYHPVPMRLKTTLFDSFYFSANYHLSHSYNLDVVSEAQNGVFREFYLLNGTIQGMVMANDKERSKTYQQAVAEQWPLEKLKEVLPL